ncbi:MAG TPA: hypothetical protein VKU00_18345 [Chthonomonadaceae bacterium]|nr:hypothetical protein [Chthonomonadaceae bacterium]
MKRLATLWGAALALALGIGMMMAAPKTAQAQEPISAELQKDWAIRIGVYIYNSQATRSANGELGISGIVERTVYRGDLFDVNVGIGYNGFDRIYSIPVQVTGIVHKNNLRFGGGVGYSFNKRVDGRGSDGTALSLLLGYQLAQGRAPLSIDLRYYFIGGSDSELDGLSLTLGGKF